MARPGRPAWNSGNHAVIGTTLQIGGDAGNRKAGERLLDVATDNRNATLQPPAAPRKVCRQAPPMLLTGVQPAPSPVVRSERPRRHRNRKIGEDGPRNGAL
jgi:hypothetical protein